MPITRTINYTQNVPVNLGFIDYLNPVPSRTVTYRFDFSSPLSDAKMGWIKLGNTTGVVVNESHYNPDGSNPARIEITGEVTALNAAMNTAEFINHFYSCETIEQDFLSENRELPTDAKGELQIQIAAGTDISTLTIGGFCRISSVPIDSNLNGRFTVVAIDQTNSAIRVWVSYVLDYTTDDLYFNSQRKNVKIGDNLLSSGGSITYGPIIDVSYNNPHGQLTVPVTIFEGNTQIETGTITLNGQFYIAEPFFVTPPPTEIQAPTPTFWYRLPADTTQTFAVIDQVDDNFQSIQLLFKYLENDPLYLGVTSYTSLPGYPTAGTELQKLAFIGAAIDTKAQKNTPVYIVDKSYGVMGVTQVQDRTSKSLDTGIVRWHFYGTPDQCNEAFKKITYYRPPNNTKDFTIETRIVNGRTRIYEKRGK